MEKYARVCDISGKGMNEGWCWSDGVFYSATREDTIAELRRDIEKGVIDLKSDLSDTKLLNKACKEEMLYWTTWGEDEDDYDDGYYTEDGTFIEN